MDEPLNILHLETGNHLYGGALQVIYLMSGLEKMGLQNTLVAAEGSAIAPHSSSFAKTFEIPMKGEMDPRILFFLLSIIRKQKPQLIHVHSRRGADLWGGLAARLTRTKGVLTRRVDNREASLVAGTKYKLYDLIIAISEEIHRVLLSEGVPAEKTACIPSAVAHHLYEGNCNREWFSNEFRLDPKVRAIGMIAQLIPRKGHRYLIEAAPKILQSCPEARFLIFGQGPLRESLERSCAEKGLSDQVLFAGFRPDLRRILPCLDLLIHPATMEGLGVALLQAAAAALPIVAAKAGGIPEIVRDGENGYLTRPGDADAIAGAAIALLKDPEKARLFGEAGKALVISKFSVEQMVQGNLRQYRRLLPRGAPV